MSDLEAQVRQEMTDIVSILEESTALPSRWSGRVALVPDAYCRGRKPLSCDILIHEALAEQDTRWLTLIHEALHSLSAGYVRTDYADLRGWEEGVGEQLQRLFCRRVLVRLGVAVDDTRFQLLDAEHLYNGYIAALEELRALLAAEQ